MLQELTRELGQDLKRTVMVGDTPQDIQMAMNAGAQAIAVQYRQQSDGLFDGLKPLFTALSTKQLHGWLNQNA